MSLKVRTLPLLAKFSALLTLTLALPISPAQAAISFGSPSNVNTSAMTIPTYTAMQGNLDGSIIVIATNGYLLRSTDSGTTWSPLTAAGIRYWSSVAINDSGTVIVGAESTGGIWLSTNSGVSFTLQSNGVSSSATWYGIDTNATGTVIVAANSTSTIYITSNMGTSWSAKTISGSSQNRNPALSALGDKVAVLSIGNSTIYTSADTGTSWSAQTAGGTVNTSSPTFILSRDGQRILFSRSGIAALSKSSNFGSTWETITSPSSSSIAFTATDDLTSIWFGTNGGGSYYSTNSGTSWSYTSLAGTWKYLYINPASTRWLSLINGYGLSSSTGTPATQSYVYINTGVSSWLKSSLSSNGTVQAAVSLGGEISISTDAGTTWNQASTLGRNSSWNCLAVSGDGNVIYAGAYATGLYKSLNSGSSWSQVSGGSLTGGSTNILGCATNSDGSKVAAIQDLYGIHYSSDGGSTFTLSAPNSICTSTNKFSAVTITNNGNKMAAICNAANTRIAISTNSGASWETTSATSTTFFREIKSAADGSVLIATAGSTIAPFISRDWGANWSNVTGVSVNYTGGVSVSNNGEIIVLGQNVSAGTLYYSVDKGTNFYAVTGALTGSYGFATVSGDTTKLLYGVDGKMMQLMSISLTFPQATFSSFSLNVPATFRSEVTLTATLAGAGMDGKVTFYANGKKIPGCINVPSSALVATCTWKAATRGSVNLAATVLPTDTSIPSGRTNLQVTVTNRTGRR